MEDVRGGLHREAQRLTEVRAEAHVSAEGLTQLRSAEGMIQELVQAFQPAAAHAQPGQGLGAVLPLAASQGEPPRREAGSRASLGVQPRERLQAALALIARIEVFVKSQRPALTLSFQAGSLERVEVERTGEGEIALKVHGRRGLPPPDEVALIREAVRERGLKLSSLSVA